MKVLSFNIQPVLPAKLVLCALLMGVLAACSVVAPVPTSSSASGSVPAGTYHCTSLKNGFYVFVGSLAINPDGSVEFNGGTGTWTYDDSAGQFTFNDNPFLTSGVYRAADNTLAIDIQPGATVANVEGGALTCFRQ